MLEDVDEAGTTFRCLRITQVAFPQAWDRFNDENVQIVNESVLIVNYFARKFATLEVVYSVTLLIS